MEISTQQTNWAAERKGTTDWLGCVLSLCYPLWLLHILYLTALSFFIVKLMTNNPWIWNLLSKFIHSFILNLHVTIGKTLKVLLLVSLCVGICVCTVDKISHGSLNKR